MVLLRETVISSKKGFRYLYEVAVNIETYLQFLSSSISIFYYDYNKFSKIDNTHKFLCRLMLLFTLWNSS